jgi:hypothetical protein
VGQDEDAQPLVRRAVLGGNAPLERFLSLEPVRRKQARRRRVAQSPKLSQDGLEPEGDVTGDAFEEHPFRAAFADNAGDIGPEVPGIVSAAALPGRAEGLARVACEDGVEGTAEGAGVEAAQVGPDRGRGEIPRALGCDEDGARPVLPFDEGAGVIAGFGEHEAQIEASAACAEGQSVPFSGETIPRIVS